MATALKIPADSLRPMLPDMGMLPDWLSEQMRSHGAHDPIGYLARHSRSFRFATRFLPGDRARRIAEVYAFCRFTDDLVDCDSGLSPAELEDRLREWEELVKLAYAGVVTGSPFLDQPIGNMGRAGIPIIYALELIEGMRMDIRPRRFATLAELETYTYRVAGVVGQWLTEMAGVRGRWALARAADLGHAMQLTNIVRDVGEDWERGRLYLPLDALARHGLSPADLDRMMASGQPPPRAYCDALEELMEAADRRYRMSFPGIPALPRYFQRPVLVAALVYRHIHAALRRNGYDNFRRRAYSTRLEKLWIGVKAAWLLPSIRALFLPAQPSAAKRRPALPSRELAAEALHWGRMLALGGMLCCAAAVAPASAFRNDPPDAQAQGLAQLSAADARIRAHPDSLPPRLDRLRILYVLGVKDEAFLAQADTAIAALALLSAGDSGRENLLRAYRGAVQLARAKHGFNPNRKMEHIRAGNPLLDSAVASAPEHPEIRYLRLVSGYYLPFFLGRKQQVKEDFAALARVLPGARRDYPPKWFLSVAGFVLAKGDLGEERQSALRKSMAEVAASPQGHGPVDGERNGGERG